MFTSHKIISLLFWVGFAFATIADVGNPLEDFEIVHNGSPDANITTFILDGSNSQAAISYDWVQISSGPYIEQFTDINSNGVWDAAEDYSDANGNDQYDFGEEFVDVDNSGDWTLAEDFTDINGNGIYDFELLDEAEGSNSWSGLWFGEDFTDANSNGLYDIGEDFIDINNNGQYDDANPAIVTFNASLAYNQEPKRYKFKLTITNANNQSVSDTKIVIINPEPNQAPIITFKNLDSYIEEFSDTNNNGQWDENEEFVDLNGNEAWDSEYSINCGGSTDGGEDGFECVLLFLDDNYLESVVDPEGDVENDSNYFWENSEGQISTELYSFEFESPSESHQLKVVATDSYADISEVILNINSSITNTLPSLTLNSLYDNVLENSTTVIEAQVVDSEHLLDEIDFVWDWSCTGCDESEEYLSNPRFDQSEGTASVDFNAPNVLCNEDVNNPNPQFTISLIARDPFQQSDSDLPPSQASTTIILNNINEPAQVLSVLSSFDNIQEDIPFAILIDDFEIFDPDDCSEDWNLSIVSGGSEYNVEQISGINYVTIFNPSETFDVFSKEVTIRVVDSQLAITNYTFTVSVNPVNDTPEIGVVASLLATEDEPYTLDVSALNPIDPDSDNFSIIYPDDLPANILSIDGNVINFEQHFFGSVSFPVSISDGESASSPEEVIINVASINDGPIYIGNSENFFISEDFGELILFNFGEEFDDVDLILDDSEALIYTLEYEDESSLNSVDLGYAHLNINQLEDLSPNLNLLSVPNLYSNEDGSGGFQSSQIVAVATDASLMYAQNAFNITVLPQNDAPIAMNGIDSLGMNTDVNNPTSILIDLMTISSENIDDEGNSLYDTPYAEDIDGDDWELHIVSGPSNGILSDITATSFRYSPNLSFRCIDQIEYVITDSGVDYVYNELTGEIEEHASSLESEPAIIEIIVDFCNSPPSIIDSDLAVLDELEFSEDGIIDVSDDIDLDIFTFEDDNVAEDFTDDNNNGVWDEGEDFIDVNANGIWDPADEIVSIHALNWTDSNENGEWDEGEEFYDCGQDGLCFNDTNYPGVDEGESDSKYIVESECSIGDYIEQGQCEYNGGQWETSVVFLPNYNGFINILVQANDGKDSYNLSDPYMIELFIQAVNDAPLIIDAFLIDGENNELIDENGNRIDYIIEDDLNRDFKVIFEDIDANPDLNFSPFDENDLYWNFSDYEGNSIDQKIYSSFDDVNKTFTIDSLKQDWNGEDFIEINVRDLNNATNSFLFNIAVQPLNDLPYNFSVNIYEDLSENIEYPSFLYEDLAEVEDFEGDNYKAIKYSIFYEDVDSDYSLNQYENYEFIPDNVTFDDLYQGLNLLSFNINNEVDASLDQLVYNTDILFDELREDWNGNDSILVLVSTSEIESNLDTLLFPVEVFPLNDSPEDFLFDSELYTYPLDELAFYYPCDGQGDNCTEFIHGAEFGSGDNFFRLHNDPASAEASIAYDSRFDSGKLLFKWDRSYDIDSDSLTSQYFSSNLYYRLELFESGQSDYYYVLDEVDDSIFDNNACDVFLQENSAADDDLCQGFMNNSNYGWSIIDMQELFFRYKEGFYDYADSIPDSHGFLTSIDSNRTEFSYGYIDKTGNTEYEWRVVAYNRWWDSRALYDDYNQNEETISLTDTEDMRFFIDLERPKANFSIIQNPLFHELYELYVITDEDIKGETQFGISDSQGDITFQYNTEQIGPCTDSDNDSDCDDFDYYNAFFYAGEFDSERLYKYQLNAFDVLGNAGISDYAIVYSYLLPGYFRSIESPMKTAEIIVFDYSLSQPAALIVSEDIFEYEDMRMTSVSNQINIISQNIELQSPISIRFSDIDLEVFDASDLRICRKNQYGDWAILESNVFGGVIEAEIMDAGSYALFYIEDVESFVPQTFDLIGCFPNPFNPDINIQFSIPYSTNVNLNIFDIAGKKVKSLANEIMEPGIVDISWAGIGDNGSLASSGIYFVVLEMNNSRYINKITLLK